MQKWQALLNRGVESQFKGNNRNAENLFKQAFRCVPKNDMDGQFKVTLALGLFYKRRNQMNKAQPLLKKLIDLFDKGVRENEFKKHMVYSLFADIARSQRNYSASIQYLKTALKESKISNDSRFDSMYLNQIGGDYSLAGEKEDALEYMEMAAVNKTPKEFEDAFAKVDDIRMVLYGETGQLDERKAIREKIMGRKVDEILSQKNPQPVVTIAYPPEWGKDWVSFFLHESELVTVDQSQNLKDLFHKVLRKDAHFRAMADTALIYLLQKVKQSLRNEEVPEVKSKRPLNVKDEDRVEIHMYHECHSSFLGAVRLALGGQNTQACMLLRACVENAIYCWEMHKNHSKKANWLNRMNDKQAVKNDFRPWAMMTDLEKSYSDLGVQPKLLYDWTIDEGAHPNVSAFLKNSEVRIEKTEKSLAVGHAFINPDETEAVLEKAIEVADCCLGIFDVIFDSLGLGMKTDNNSGRI